MTEILASKFEFEIQELSEEKVKRLNENLTKLKGVTNHNINKKTSRVYVEAHIPTSDLHHELERITNTLVVLKGMGTVMDSAVAEIMSDENKPEHQIRGVIRFVQIDQDNCAIDGTIDGLEPGDHALNIFENGDLTKGFENLGNHFNPFKKPHGLYNDKEKHVGDLGNICVNEIGRASFRFIDKDLKLWDVIGRSICVSEKAESKSGDSGERLNRLACGIIARSSRIFDNVKKICLCSGKTLWDERKDASLHNSAI